MLEEAEKPRTPGVWTRARRLLSLLNREATKQLRCKWELTVVPGASHLFEEPGALEGVAELAAAWFTNHLPLPRS